MYLYEAAFSPIFTMKFSLLAFQNMSLAIPSPDMTVNKVMEYGNNDR
jgi:hypothetical protein